MRGPRLSQLVAAGLVDSFGLALGWTVFNLYAVVHQGLWAVGIYNAAMLVGVGLSAPFTGWLSGRVGGRRLIRSTAAGEATLRVAGFALLLAAAPTALVAVVVGLTSLAAWTGFAGMRAEVAAAAESSRARALAWYAGGIAAIEAIGVAVGAILPTGSAGAMRGPLLAIVIGVYGLVLLPTFLVAGRARVTRRPSGAGRPPLRAQTVFLGGGFLVMLLASGPTLLAVALTAKLHGRVWVAGAAIAFTLGALVAPLVASLLDRPSLPSAVVWPALGAAMIAGWIFAPWTPLGLLLAQLLSGAAMTAFEGVMDARSAGKGEHMTSGLGWAAAARALGSAAAVVLMPAAIAAQSLEAASGVATAVLVGASVVACAALVLVRGRFARPARITA